MIYIIYIREREEKKERKKERERERERAREKEQKLILRIVLMITSSMQLVHCNIELLFLEMTNFCITYKYKD